MDRLHGKHLAIAGALALAFAGTSGLAHGDYRTSSDSSLSDRSNVQSDGDALRSGSTDATTAPNATPSSNPATSYDTGTTSPYSGALGEKSTPSAADEDHNDEGAYPPAPPNADTSNVAPEGSDQERASSHPGSEENLDGTRNGQG